jgi:hypothetical protein
MDRRHLRLHSIGDCCVFCSYGSMPCPSVQEARAPMHIVPKGQSKAVAIDAAPAEILGTLDSRQRRQSRNV